MKKLRAAALILLYLLFVMTVSKLYLADAYYKAARRAYTKGDWAGVLELADSAIFYSPNEPRYFRESAKAQIALSATTNTKHKEALMASALRSLDISIGLNPRNILTLRESIPLYYLLTLWDFEHSGLQSVLNRVKSFSPNDAGVMVLAAKYERKSGSIEHYEETIRKIKRLRPDLLRWHPSLQGGTL